MKINFKGIGFFGWDFFFFKLKKKKMEKEASKPMIQALWALLKSSDFGVFICITIARNMEAWLVLANSSSCAMTDMSEGKQVVFFPVSLSPRS